MWEDIDLETGVIQVTHNKVFPANANDALVTTLLKTASARRRVPLPAALRAFLEQARKASDSVYVLSMANGESLSKSSCRKLWAIVETRTAGEDRKLGGTVSVRRDGPIQVTLDFTCHPHQLRHTYATKLFEAGLDIKQVQYLLGHSTTEMTLRVYTHYRARCRASETADQVCTAMDYLAV